MRIVLFDIDCLRPDHLGCYGYGRPTSPAIDRIAENGVRFDNYYCSSAPCLPSRAALFSGRFGINNGVISNAGAGANFHIKKKEYGGPKPENEMLAQLFRANGYNTISVSNFADRHNAMWFMYGWTEFYTPNLKSGWETAEEVNEFAIPWLKRNAKRDNLFLHIIYWDVHRPYRMDASWADRFKGTPAPEWPDKKTIAAHQKLTGLFTAHDQRFENNKSPWPLMPDSISNRADFEHMITGYDAAIAYVDHHLSAILDELEKQGVLDETAIIISADHGDAFGEHGIYSDHCCADECIHSIPLIIKWPGAAKPKHISKSPLYNVDLAPTICDLLGFTTPRDWDGQSFREHIEGKTGIDREYIVWDYGLYSVQRAVRTKTHLMVRTYDDYGYAFDPVELYDIVNDKHQTKNIRDEHPEIVEKCNNYLTEWLNEQKSKGHAIPDPIDEILRERSKDPTWR